MEDPRSDSLNELVANFSEEEFAKLKEYVERRDRATAPAAAALQHWYVHALDRP